ncbi:MAG: DUF2335 domain-containing protein [Rickettsiaceae bacterium]
MKESKNFFYNNRLNKGYAKVRHHRQTDLGILKKQYEHVLPPLEMMEEYEEQYPGTFDKLFNMAEKEQQHKHAIDLANMEQYKQANRLGKIFAIIVVVLIILGSVVLALSLSNMIITLFLFFSFTCVLSASYLYTRSRFAVSPDKITGKKHYQVIKKNSNYSRR